MIGTINKDISASALSAAILWRQHLHRNPELAFSEVDTSVFIAGKLRAFGYEVTEGVGKTGVIGSLSKGRSRKSIGIRAEMDALPMVENGDVSHRSIRPGVMHACGHDGHIAMALLAAERCSHGKFDGTVHFIFQPAEENEGGARALVDDGLLERFPCESIYAMHNWPSLAVGTISTCAGPMMAALGLFEIVIEGLGCHAAMPNEGTDVILVGSQLVTALQAVVSRNVSPSDAAVISISEFHGGTTTNVLPNHCNLRGTARWFKKEVGELIHNRIQEVAEGLARAFSCSAQVTFEERYPAVVNDANLTLEVTELVKGHSHLQFLDATPSMGSDDFAFLSNKVPGCYVWLGSQRSANNCALHSPMFDFNDDALKSGAEFWLSLIESKL